MQRFVKRGRPSRFIEALTNDDVGVLKKLVLQDSGSVETEWPGHLCCQHGAHACLSFLIDCCGLDVDDVTAKGTLTALHIACQHRRQRCVSALIARGALVEARTARGSSPLHVACRHRCSSIVQLLLVAGADPNVQSASGRNALHIACELNAAECVALLLSSLQRRADLRARTAKGATALMIGAQHGALSALKLVLRVASRADVLATVPSTGLTALHVAAQHNRAAAAQLLLAAGADRTATTRSGSTPLTYAIRDGSTDLIAMLMRPCSSSFVCVPTDRDLDRGLLLRGRGRKQRGGRSGARAPTRVRVLRLLKTLRVPQLAPFHPYLQSARERCSLKSDHQLLKELQAMTPWTKKRHYRFAARDRRGVFALLLTFARLGRNGSLSVLQTSCNLDPAMNALSFLGHNSFQDDDGEKTCV